MSEGVNISELHDEIVAAAAAQFPDLRTVGDYLEDRDRLELPALTFELETLDAVDDDDSGTEQLIIAATWRARIVLGFRTPEVEREVRMLVAALCAWLHRRRFDPDADIVEIVSAEPDAFEPELDQFVVWAVEFRMRLALGESVWRGAGDVPTALFSYAPRTGPDFEPFYTEIVPDVGS